MDPQSQNNQPVIPAKPAPMPEVQSPPTIELGDVPTVPEQPKPEQLEQTETIPAPEAPAAPELDHLSAVAPLPTDDVNIPTQPAVPVAPADEVSQAQTDAVAEPETADEDALDKKYYAAAEEAIDQLGGKPYEEEEKAEDLQIGYLKEKFGKELHKSDD